MGGSGLGSSGLPRTAGLPLWHTVLLWRLPPVCSEHLPAGQAGEPPALVPVVPATLMGHGRLPLCTAAGSDLEKGLQDALRDIITSCDASELKHDLRDWVPSRYKPF